METMDTAGALRDRFRTVLRSTDLLPSGAHLLVAVSGGKDSMSLLHLLCALREKFAFRLTVGHVNHHLRPSSMQDEELVVKTSEQWALTCLVAHLDPDTKVSGESVEAWARRERYTALETLRKQCNADWVVTAHHQKDQAETVLAHLTTGCGISGLQGIHPQLGRVVRPLLSIPRKDIDVYCDANNLSFIEDPTNRNEDHPRNFLRHQIIPLWSEAYPALEQNLERVTRQAKETEEALAFAVQELLPAVVVNRTPEVIHLSTEALNRVPILLQIRLIKYLSGGKKDPWRRNVYEDLKTFLKHARTGHVLSLPGTWQLLKDRATLILKRLGNSSKQVYTLVPGDTLDCDDFYFHWKWVETATFFPNDPWKETIDGTRFKDSTLTLRHWQPGDAFQPLGMNGTKKVSNFLTDEKVNHFSKEDQWLLLVGNEILWLCGRRISEKVKITPETKYPAELSMIPKVRSL